MAEEQSGEQILAVPKGKGKAKAKGRAKYLQDFEDLSPEDCLAQMKKRFEVAEATIKEAAALETAQTAQVDQAQKEFDAAQQAVKDAMEAEVTAARKYRELTEKRQEVTQGVDEQRAGLYEAQKKLAMLEVFKTNQETMRLLEERRKAAIEAAQQAKRSLVEHRQNERKAQEATKQALASLPGKGAKRAAPEGDLPPAKRAPAEADGQDIE